MEEEEEKEEVVVVQFNPNFLHTYWLGFKIDVTFLQDLEFKFPCSACVCVCVLVNECVCKWMRMCKWMNVFVGGLVNECVQGMNVDVSLCVWMERLTRLVVVG